MLCIYSSGSVPLPSGINCRINSNLNLVKTKLRTPFNSTEVIDLVAPIVTTNSTPFTFLFANVQRSKHTTKTKNSEKQICDFDLGKALNRCSTILKPTKSAFCIYSVFFSPSAVRKYLLLFQELLKLQ